MKDGKKNFLRLVECKYENAWIIITITIIEMVTWGKELVQGFVMGLGVSGWSLDGSWFSPVTGARSEMSDAACSW